MKPTTASLAALLIAACSSGGSTNIAPPQKDSVLWDCTCSADGALGTTQTVEGDDIPEKQRCGATDPSNALEDSFGKGWMCEPCTATATLCTTN